MEHFLDFAKKFLRVVFSVTSEVEDEQVTLRDLSVEISFAALCFRHERCFFLSLFCYVEILYMTLFIPTKSL